MTTQLYVPDDHTCTCPNCSEEVRDYYENEFGRPFTFRAGVIPPSFFDHLLLGGYECAGCYVFYDGSQGGEPYSLHLAVMQSDLERVAPPSIIPHRCRTCGGGRNCMLLLRGEATKITPVWSQYYLDSEKFQEMYQRIVRVYSKPKEG